MEENNIELKIPDSFTRQPVMRQATKYTISQQVGDDPSNKIACIISGLRIYLKPSKVPPLISYVSLNIDDRESDYAIGYAIMDDEGKYKYEIYKYNELENEDLKNIFMGIRNVAYNNYVESMTKEVVFAEKHLAQDNLMSSMVLVLLAAENLYKILHGLQPVDHVIKDIIHLNLDFIGRVGVLRDYDLTT